MAQERGERRCVRRNLSNHFENTWLLGKSLSKLAKLKNSIHLAVNLEGTTLTLFFDAAGDVFREWSGQLALTLHGAAAHGATGPLVFLGTAGAEYDFSYELTLAKGKSTLKTLGTAAINKVYEGEEYTALTSRSWSRQEVVARAPPELGTGPNTINSMLESALSKTEPRDAIHVGS